MSALPAPLPRYLPAVPSAPGPPPAGVAGSPADARPPHDRKAALEALLEAKRLESKAPPLRGEVRHTPLPTGLPEVDAILRGGFPRGQMSEVHGPPSSGRTGLLTATVARATAAGALAAWVDPGDRFDPSSAAAAGGDLGRLLWLRGLRGRAGEERALSEAAGALATVLGSGLFACVVFDLAGLPARELRRLPGTTWIRLQRAVAPTSSALVLLADAHVAASPLGVSLALAPQGPRFAGAPGPGRLLAGLGAFAEAGPYARRHASFALRAV